MHAPDDPRYLCRDVTVMGSSTTFKKGEKRPNQGKRGPGKATVEVREAISQFATANVESMTEWLGAIDDPAKKMDLFLRAIEYHIPKLARSEISGPGGGPQELIVSCLPIQD